MNILALYALNCLDETGKCMFLFHTLFRHCAPTVRILLHQRHKYFITHHIDNTLRWRHNGHDSVSNHQPPQCLLNRLFGCRSKKTSKLRVTGLCAGNSPGTGEFPAQMASNAENVPIRWRHPDHDPLSCQSISSHVIDLFIPEYILTTATDFFY